MMEGLWGISREDGFNGANVLVDVRTKHVRMNIYPLPRKGSRGGVQGVRTPPFFYNPLNLKKNKKNKKNKNKKIK